jgi:small-conductance mechanosensitive channel
MHAICAAPYDLVGATHAATHIKGETMFDPEARYFGLTVITWGTGLLALLLVAVAHITLRWWVRRRVRNEGSEPTTTTDTPTARYWIARGLAEAVPPVACLLWIQGLKFALSTLAADLANAEIAVDILRVIALLHGIATVVTLAWLLARIARTLEALLKSFASGTNTTWDDVFAPFAGRALRLVLPLLAVILGVPALAFSPEAEQVIQNGVSLLLIGVIAFLLLQFVNALSAFVINRNRMDVADNREARAIYTQVSVLKRIGGLIIVVFAIASMLMVFESVRQFGTAIIASAGVAGIIVGFAAQKSIATLLAGFQIALTQPIRIDDVVIVEGEWGRIEEITLTYVVVRIWDLRRLVLPITYFIEQPFQNWTRTSADLLGTVYLYLDYTVPMTELRAELSRILNASPLWDKKVQVLQITDTKERTIEVRALMSARDAGTAFDLRCEVREKLIDFLQRNYPQSLPRVRADMPQLEHAKRLELKGDVGGMQVAQ